MRRQMIEREKVKSRFYQIISNQRETITRQRSWDCLHKNYPSQIQNSLQLISLSTCKTVVPFSPYQSLISYILQLRKGDADYRARKWTCMLAHKGFGRLLLGLELNKSLLFSIHLKDLAVDNGSVLFQEAYYLLFGYVLWEGGQVDHLCRRAAVPIVFGSIAIESVEI